MTVTPTGIFYQSVGSGYPVLMLHGAVLESGVWAFHSDALESSHHCVIPDRRGHGRSDPVADGYDPVQDLISVLDDAGVDRCHVIAHSLGGYDAVGLAGRHPERVRSLVLVGAWMPIPAMTWSPPVKIAREEGPAAARQAWLADPLFDTVRRDPASWAAITAMVEANDFSLWTRRVQTPEPKPPSPVDLAPTIKAPTQVAVGQFETAPFAAVAAWLRSVIPGAAPYPIAAVPCAGHMVPMEHPTYFSELVHTFFTQVEAGGLG